MRAFLLGGLAQQLPIGGGLEDGIVLGSSPFFSILDAKEWHPVWMAKKKFPGCPPPPPKFNVESLTFVLKKKTRRWSKKNGKPTRFWDLAAANDRFAAARKDMATSHLKTERQNRSRG